MAVITERKTKVQTGKVNARALLAAFAVAFPLVMCLLGMLVNLWWSGR
jgi:hypothetical protein